MLTANVITIPLAELQFVKELYPRVRESDAAIERYRAGLDLLPPIVVARGRVLVDGYHRWKAHEREERKEMQAEDLGDLTDAEILVESYRRNARHGHQLSQVDKIAAANHLYFSLPGVEEERYETIAEILSLNLTVAKKYAAQGRADYRRMQRERAWQLWLECHTQNEIAELLGELQQTISNWIQKRESDSRFCRPPGATDKQLWGVVQHFDVWSFAQADDDAGQPSIFGRLPPQVVENLLWLYTEPGQIVVDPFVGGGTTIDVAQEMGRRVWASDLHPRSELLPIHEHNITMG